MSTQTPKQPFFLIKRRFAVKIATAVYMQNCLACGQYNASVMHPLSRVVVHDNDHLQYACDITG